MPKAQTEKKRATDGIDYKQKYYDLFRQKEKEKAFVSKEKDWAAEDEESDEEEFINLAFMADSENQEASSSTSQVLTNISVLPSSCTIKEGGLNIIVPVVRL